MKTKTLLPVIIAVAVVAAMFVPSILWPKGPHSGGDRSQWAKPIAKPGLPNLHQVNAVLYRGARPTREGIAELGKMGVKTIVNLELSIVDPEPVKDDVGGTGIEPLCIGCAPWHPEEKDVVQFLKAATDTSKQPLFVHCCHGSDRTGMMCAVYRIVVDGWTKDQAIAEMTGGGFGFHPVWQNMIDYIRAMDVAKLKAKCGID